MLARVHIAVWCLATLGAFGSATKADEQWQPTPLPLDTAFTEAQPPRVLLEQTVTVMTSGNVAEVVRQLAEATGRDWVVSAPSDDFGQAQEFRVENMVLWQAMDRLLEVYGYDWGVHARVLVAWPATKPARERLERPALEEETWEDPAPREPLVVAKPTPVADLLVPLSRPWDGEAKAEYVYVAQELRPWRVVGSIARLDRLNGQAIGLAVGAVMDGAAGAHVLEYGTLRRLDDAIAFRATMQLQPDQSVARTSAKMRLRAAILGSLNAQQWVYLRSSGEAQVAFRELPTEAAALFLEAADEIPRIKDGEWRVDWTQPQRMYVSVRSGAMNMVQEDGTVLTTPRLQVTCHMPLTDGAIAGF